MIKNLFNKIRLTFGWLVIVLILGIIYLFTYSIAEPKAYDFMVQNVLIQKFPFDTQKNVYGHDDIVLVVIDTKSVEKYRWPWKRELYCGLLEYFSKYAHSKVIVYDSILNTLDQDNPQSDKKYFDCVKGVDNFVTGFMLTGDDWINPEFGKIYDKNFKDKFSLNIENRKKHLIDENIWNIYNGLNEYKSLLIFPKPYFDVVKNIGSVQMFMGPINGNPIVSDQIVRCFNHFIRYKDAYYPSLSMKTYLVINKIFEIILTDKEIIFPEINHKIEHVHYMHQNAIPLKFYELIDGRYSHKNYSAIDILQSYNNIIKGQKPLINPKIFRDKIVIIGAFVPAGDGLNDSKNSPVTVNHPGVDLQATAIDNLVHDDFLTIIPQYINFIITLLGMFLVYFSIKSLNLTKSVTSVITILAGFLIICIACFYFDIVVNVITPIVMFVMSTIFAYTHKYVIENRNKEKVQNAMGKYMSKDVMQRVIANIDNLGLGGKRAVVTVLFADIRGFTSISERLSAQQVSEILNEYFSEMEPIISSYNGIINKFIGDAIMAVFGEPIQDENHAQNSVKCAYAMLQKLKILNKKWVNEGKPEIEIGIGINTGDVFVGNIGSNNRMEYTVIGDTVNLASRLESYNKMYKTKILISPTTYKDVRKIADVIKIPEVEIRGKTQKIDIYEVLKVKID